MTYIEKALYDFVKTILTRGIRTLKDPKYLPYSIFILILVGFSTVVAFIGDLTQVNITTQQMDLLLYLELSAAIGFTVVGLIIGKMKTGLQMGILLVITFGTAFAFWQLIPNASDLGILLAALFYIAWITIATFSTFSLFRDLFENDVFGMVLFLGKPEDDGRPMFSLIAWILVFVNIGLGYFIYNQGIEGQLSGSTALAYTGLVIIATGIIASIPLLNIQPKFDVFFTILTTFYMFTTIRIVILAFKSLTATAGQTSFWDTLFSLFIALYTIQSAAVKGIKIGEADSIELTVEEKLMAKEKHSLGLTKRISNFFGDKGIILMILGAVIGFHTMQVQSFLGRENIFNDIEFTQGADIILVGYQVNLAVSLVIYLLAILGFILIPAFRRYANPEVRRVVWAPEYDDVKLLVAAFKDGDLSWKSESLKLAGSISKNKLKGIVGSGGTVEDTIAHSIEGWIETLKEDARKQMQKQTK